MDIPDNWFNEWFGSPYYQQLYVKRDDQEADAFITRITDYLHPPKESFMLVAGCGDGSHAARLASNGFDVTGIDLLIENIDKARAHESEKLHFFQHDLRLPFWIKYFDYAFNLFTNFGHFRTEREHYNAIRTIANSLKPGGTLLVDYLNVHYTEDQMLPQVEQQVDGVHFNVSTTFDDTHFYRKIIVESGQAGNPLTFHERVAKFSLGDFNDMFAFHKLQLQDVFGDYEFNRYNLKTSPRMVMLAKKV